jgi:hypothetical protein
MKVQDIIEFEQLSPRSWICHSGDRTYRIYENDNGYACSCPARVECKHIKELKSRRSQMQPQPPAQPVQSSLPVQAGPTTVQQLEQQIAMLEDRLSMVGLLGFAGDRQYVFVGANNGGLWYTLDSAGNYTNIDSRVLVGYIRQIEFKKNNNDAVKLHLHVDADRRYVLVCGFDCNFAKGVLMALSVMTPQAIARAVNINPQLMSGNGRKFVVCNLHQNRQLIRARYGPKTNWREVTRKAMKNVHDAQAL